MGHNRSSDFIPELVENFCILHQSEVPISHVQGGQLQLWLEGLPTVATTLADNQPSVFFNLNVTVWKMT